MKKLVACIFLLFGMAGAAFAEDPVDLVTLQEAGLSAETIGRYLAQNLDSTRLAPPISADLLSRLGSYGGNELAASYLNLDKQTAHLKQRDFSPEVIEQLLAGDVGAEKLKTVLNDEAKRAMEAAKAVPAPKTLPTLPTPQVRVTETELPPPAADIPPRPAVAPSPATPPAAPALAPPQPAPAAPVPPPAPQAAAPQAPQGPRFQDLRPGQAADPGSKLPPPLDTYELRQEPAQGHRMGVTERKLQDGHRVEVNIMGDPSVVGQDVISRPSGHKVYRYHSGNTGAPAPISDPEQERRNREDLQIIHGGGK